MRRFGEYGAAAACDEAENPLWRLHRKEPGCVVGEHMQVRFCWPCLFTVVGAPVRGATEMERFGEIDRSRENRTDEADAEEGPHKLTRVGEVAR